MPETPLTEILEDFRSYRPGNHREFLEWVRDRAGYVGIKEYAMKHKESAGKTRSSGPCYGWLIVTNSTLPACFEPSKGLPLATLVFHERIHFEEDSASNSHGRKPDRIGKSRKEQIHYGGHSAADTWNKWLPNQLFSVLDQMIEVEELFRGLSGCQNVMNLVHSQKIALQKEVDKYCSERSI